MKKVKKILSLVLAVMMCFSVVPMTDLGIEARAASETTLSAMRERAEAIINYKWTPSQNINTWNGNTYNGRTYFKKGETVTGMPYTLFTTEVVSFSLLSLSQYKSKASSNYSTTAYCVSTGSNRTGPVYGSCCADFVCEVFGGKFMNGSSMRYHNVQSIQNSSYGKTNKNVKASDIEAGDALSNTTGTHIVWVGEVTDSYLIIYEQTPPVAKKTKVYKSSAINSNGYLVYGGSVYNIVTKSKEFTNNIEGNPTITSASGISNSEIALVWEKVSSATSYLIQRRESGTDTYYDIKTTTATSFTDSGLKTGKRYYYKISAYNASTKIGTSGIGVYTKPASPTVTAITNSKLEISWKNVSKAVDYTILRRQSGAEAYEIVTTVTDTSYVDSGLLPATKYYYRIQANCDIDGVKMTAKSTTGGQYTLTNAPEITNIDGISKSEISVIWTSVEGASSYRIERRRAGDSKYTTIVDELTSTSYTDSGLETGKRYFYRIYAKNPGGESYSKIKCGYTDFNRPSVETAGVSQLNLSWDAVSYAESYTIKRRSCNEDSYKAIKTVAATTYTDTGLDSGTKYYYIIQANCKIESFSAIANSTVGSNFTQIPTPTATTLNSNSLRLNWTTVKDETLSLKYNIQRKTLEESTFKTIATVTSNSYTDTGLNYSSTYCYRIQVVDTNNEILLTSSEFNGKTSSCPHNTAETKNAKNATCTSEGYTGDTYCKTCGAKTKIGSKIAKKSHTIVTDKALAPTCTKTGLTEGKHCSACGTISVAQTTVAAKGHKDANGDYKCDNGCGYEYEKPAPDTPSDSTDNCSCNCHKGGIAGFFFKIILFFQKLFKTNKICACGVAHY